MTWTTIYNTLGVANLWAAMQVEPAGFGQGPSRHGASSPNRHRVALAAMPAFKAFVQGFADDAMNNVLKLFA
jgi:hypothetical protein